ncbi:hypothetical protein D3C83_254560 [compost metagenome]
MVGPSVDAVDHGIGGATQLVVEPAIDETANDGVAEAFARQHKAGGTALDTSLGQGSVQALDDVATFTEFA